MRNDLFAMYFAQNAKAGYPPIITDGLVCYDPLVAINQYTQIGHCAITLGAQGGEAMTIEGVKCVGNVFWTKKIGDFINIDPSYLPYGNQPFTYAIWCRCTRVSNDATGTKMAFLRGNFVTTGNPQRFAIHQNPTYNATQTVCDLKNAVNAHTTPFLLAGTWIHQCVTYTGTNFKWYMNGAQKWTTNQTMAIPQNSALKINAEGSSGMNCYTRLYVFNRALTTNEVATLANEDLTR